MGQFSTPRHGQQRQAFWRTAVITVPIIVILGSLMGYLSNSGYSNLWFAALDLPDITPPGWVFATVWPLLYVLMALSLAMILTARHASGRGFALILFFVQLIANLAWSPVFFGAHQVTLGLYLIIFILMVTVATTFAFGRIRPAAAWLLVPYMAWLCFASILNFQIDRQNPDAETLVPNASTSQMR
jgi:translocator protein